MFPNPFSSQELFSCKEQKPFQGSSNKRRFIVIMQRNLSDLYHMVQTGLASLPFHFLNTSVLCSVLSICLWLSALVHILHHQITYLCEWPQVVRKLILILGKQSSIVTWLINNTIKVIFNLKKLNKFLM